jgi:hypothetical protein
MDDNKNCKKEKKEKGTVLILSELKNTFAPETVSPQKTDFLNPRIEKRSNK